MAEWIRRRQGPDALPLTLQRRRLYILPTRAGVGFAVLLFFMLVAGLNYANSLALFLTFLLTGFALVAMHQCHRNLLGTSLASALATPTFARQPGHVQLVLENSSPLQRYRIEVDIEDADGGIADVGAASRQRLELTVPPAARGILRIERLKVATAHPFGLFRAWTWIHTPLEMIVYPRPQGRLPIPTDSGQRHAARTIGGSGTDEWLGLRPFRDGDSPRQVDWKAYAREAPLLVKEYGAAGSELRVLRFDDLVDLPTEERLEQLARWVVDAETRGDRYALELPGVSIGANRGPEHRHRCLAALAVFGKPATQA
jgi:uncharacterized protein (DUF58 family)